MSELKKSEYNVYHSYNDADIDFMRLVVQSSLTCLVTVIGEDTDFLVLLLCHGNDNSKPLNFQNQKLILNKHMCEISLVFTTSNIIWRDRISWKKGMSVILKGNTDQSLNSLCHKQVIWKITMSKAFVKLETLPQPNQVQSTIFFIVIIVFQLM